MNVGSSRTGSPAVLDALRLRRASVYGAGSGLDEALDVSRRLATYGIGSAIGYSAFPNESARAVADGLLAAYSRLSTEDLDCYVSIKLSALALDRALYAELAAAAASSGRRLHIDSLRPDTAALTWELAEATPRAASLGMTLPGRWRRSLVDATRAVELGVDVRVVKGHWADDVGGTLDPRAGFLEVIDRLSGSTATVAVATHDVKLLGEALRRLARSGTRSEVELFLGMPFRGPARVAQSYGAPVRLYVPYGDAWPGYGVPDLVSHPKTLWWLVQDLVLGSDKTWRSIRRARTRG
jgi:proline dehydrogenase